MPKFQGIIGSIGRVGAGITGGITGNTTVAVTVGMLNNASNTPMWDAAWFGVSVTTIGTQSFNVYVTFPFGALALPIAGLSGIGTTAAALIPIVNEKSVGSAQGTTQYSFSGGIPTPTSITFGNSATPGQSYSAIVYATLYKAN